jgi:hypothetical protein
MAQKRNFWLNTITLAVLLAGSLFNAAPAAAAVIPVTDGSNPQIASSVSSILPISEFSSAVEDGQDIIRGVYVDNVMALRVVQQPATNANYVSSISGVATQFKAAEKYGTIGLLAHNFAAGSFFTDIQVGDVINTIYGNGDISQYKVSKIVRYQALSPESASSNFVDLVSGEKLTAAKLFEKVYKGDRHLVLQTCIAKDNEASWGRLFILADPVEKE